MGSLKQNLEAARAAIVPVDHLMGSTGGAPNKEAEVAAGVPVPVDIADLVGGMGVGTAIKWQLNIMSAQRKLEQQMGLIRGEMARKHRGSDGPNFKWSKQALLDLAALAEQHKAGQCNEQVAVAFKHLRAKGVTPIDMMLLIPTNRADHTFLVIGRQPARGQAANVGDWDVPDNGAPPWGPDAVVCDPWSPVKSERVYPAAELRKRMTMHDWWGVKTIFRWTGN